MKPLPINLNVSSPIVTREIRTVAAKTEVRSQGRRPNRRKFASCRCKVGMAIASILPQAMPYFIGPLKGGAYFGPFSSEFIANILEQRLGPTALGGDLRFDPFRLGGTAGLGDAAWLNGATTSVCVRT